MTAIGGPRWQQSRHVPPSVPQRILYIPVFADAPIEPVIASAVAAVAEELAKQGHHVEPAHRFDLAWPISEIWPIISQTGLAWLLSRHTEVDLGPTFDDMARAGRAYSAIDYAGALDAIRAVAREFDALFERFDVLLTPAAPVKPFAVEMNFPTEINGQTFENYIEWIAPAFLVTLVSLPAGSVPAGMTADGLPVGMQVVAPRFEEPLILRVAKLVQQSSGVGWPPVAVAAQ